MKFRKALAIILINILVFAAGYSIYYHIRFSGSCGENVRWYYSYATKTLTVSGTGEMENYESDHCTPQSADFDIDIENIVIEKGVTAVGDYAFSSERAGTVTFADTVTHIGKNAFENNHFTDVTLPESVEHIGEGAFHKCITLEQVVIKGEITAIEKNVFNHCISLVQVELPATLTLIKGGAFADCLSLTDIYFKGTDGQWQNITVEPAYNRHILPNVTVHCEYITVKQKSNNY